MTGAGDGRSVGIALTVGMALGAQPPDTLMALCREAGRRTPLVDAGDLPGGRGPLLLRLGDATRAVGDPVVAWVDHLDALDRNRDTLHDASLVIGDDAAVLDAARVRGFAVRSVPSGEPWPDAVPVAPFVRTRLRAARGLAEPATLVCRGGRWDLSGPDTVPDDAVEPALALASAIVVDTPHALLGALAWGCPAVTDAGTAAAVGAEPGRDCLVEAGAGHAAAAALARDDVLAARLSWHGRRRYELDHSLRYAADDVLRALGVPGRWAPSRLERELETLDSHRGPLEWLRETAAVAGIVPGTTGRTP